MSLAVPCALGLCAVLVFVSFCRCFFILAPWQFVSGKRSPKYVGLHQGPCSAFLQELRQEISNLEEQLSLSQEGPEE